VPAAHTSWRCVVFAVGGASVPETLETERRAAHYRGENIRMVSGLFLYVSDESEESMNSTRHPRNIVHDAILKEITNAVDALEYGTVTIKVHEKKIIQIEIAERRRFDDVWKLSEGAGI
jgi:hypothetical protein